MSALQSFDIAHLGREVVHDLEEGEPAVLVRTVDVALDVWHLFQHLDEEAVVLVVGDLLAREVNQIF